MKPISNMNTLCVRRALRAMGCSKMESESTVTATHLRQIHVLSFCYAVVHDTNLDEPELDRKDHTIQV